MLPRRLAPIGNTDQNVCMGAIYLALGTILGLPECPSVRDRREEATSRILGKPLFSHKDVPTISAQFTQLA